MAEFEQMLRGELAAALVVADDPAHAGENFPRRRDRRPAARSGCRWCAPVPAWRAGAASARPGRGAAPRPGARSVFAPRAFRSRRRSSEGPSSIWRPSASACRSTPQTRLRVVGVVDLRHDDADESAASQAQILRGAIRDIIAAAGFGLDARLGADADVGRVAKRLGDGHDR